MENSIFVAELLGPVYIAAGVASLVNSQRFRTIVREFIASATWLYVAGVLGLLAGLALVLTHNIWALDWRLIITLIGWVMIVRAVVAIFWPQRIVAIGSALLEQRGLFIGAAALNLVIGVVLSYFGYFA